MIPHGLTLLKRLRSLGQAPELAVLVTDDWRYVPLAEEIGALAIYVKPEHHACDWSPIAGLFVILIANRSSAAAIADLSTALLRANPSRLEALTRSGLRLVWDAEKGA
jgi:hypothetical protein